MDELLREMEALLERAQLALDQSAEVLERARAIREQNLQARSVTRETLAEFRDSAQQLRN